MGLRAGSVDASDDSDLGMSSAAEEGEEQTEMLHSEDDEEQEMDEGEGEGEGDGEQLGEQQPVGAMEGGRTHSTQQVALLFLLLLFVCFSCFLNFFS